MKKYFLVWLTVCLPFLLRAQKADTVAEKLALLPYTQCEIRPECKGSRIDEFILGNFIRPKIIKGNYIGDVVVGVLIDSLGKVDKVELVKTQSPEIDQETIRVLSLTKWKPAIYNFNHVNYNMVLHLRIKNDSLKNIFKVDTYVNYKVRATTKNSDEIYTTIETEPTFPGGINAFYDYLSSNITYPKNAKKNNIQGTVFITFVVEKDGSLSDMLILRSPDDELSLEALRVLKLCPKFNPGIQNEKPVRVYYTMPIKFSLKAK